MKNKEILEGRIYLSKLMGIQVKVDHSYGTDWAGRPQGDSTTFAVVNKYHMGNHNDIADGDKVTFRVEQSLPGYGPHFFGVSQTPLRCTILTINHEGVVRDTEDKTMNIHPERLRCDVIINFEKFKSEDSESFKGRDYGKLVRLKLGLNMVDEDRKYYEFVIPNDITISDLWFFSGLFLPSLEKLGEKRFNDKYSFKFETYSKEEKMALQKVIDSNIRSNVVLDI